MACWKEVSSVAVGPGMFRRFQAVSAGTESSTESHEFSSNRARNAVPNPRVCFLLLLLVAVVATGNFQKTWTMVSKGITEKEKTFELCPSRKKRNSQGWIMVWGTLTSQIHVYYIKIPRHGQKNKADCIKLPVRLVST